jgi:hypothetical protein
VELPVRRGTAASARKALRDGLLEALGVAAAVGPELAAVSRTLTHRELELIGFEVRLKRDPTGLGLRWVTSLELERLAIPSAVRALLASLPPAEAGQGPEK